MSNLKTTKTIKFDNSDLLINADEIQFIKIEGKSIKFRFSGNSTSVECKSTESAREVVDKIEGFLHNENSNDNQIEYSISFGDI